MELSNLVSAFACDLMRRFYDLSGHHGLPRLVRYLFSGHSASALLLVVLKYWGDQMPD
jgi:hypothetical protein